MKQLEPHTAQGRELGQRVRGPAGARGTQDSPRGRSSVYKSMTTSPRVVSRRTAMAPASPQEQTPGNDRCRRRASATCVTSCATRVASSGAPSLSLEAQLPAACRNALLACLLMSGAAVVLAVESFRSFCFVLGDPYKGLCIKRAIL